MTDEQQDDGEPAVRSKRLIDRGLFWLGLVVVIAVGALVVSFVAEDDGPQDAVNAGPPSDTLAFCTAARQLSELPEPTIEVGQPSTDLRNIQLVLDEMAQAAPGSVAASINRVRDALTPVIEQAEQPSDDADALSQVTELLDEQTAAVADDDAAVTAYIERYCGFDPASAGTPSSAPSSTVPADGGDGPTTSSTTS